MWCRVLYGQATKGRRRKAKKRNETRREWFYICSLRKLFCRAFANKCFFIILSHSLLAHVHDSTAKAETREKTRKNLQTITANNASSKCCRNYNFSEGIDTWRLNVECWWWMFAESCWEGRWIKSKKVDKSNPALHRTSPSFVSAFFRHLTMLDCTSTLQSVELLQSNYISFPQQLVNVSSISIPGLLFVNLIILHFCRLLTWKVSAKSPRNPLVLIKNSFSSSHSIVVLIHVAHPSSPLFLQWECRIGRANSATQCSRCKKSLKTLLGFNFVVVVISPSRQSAVLAAMMRQKVSTEI